MSLPFDVVRLPCAYHSREHRFGQAVGSIVRQSQTEHKSSSTSVSNCLDQATTMDGARFFDNFSDIFISPS